MANVRALIRPGALALVWLLAGATIAWRAASYTDPKPDSHTLLVPLSPSTWRHTGATHAALITGPALWCALPDRIGIVRRAVRIHARWTQLPGQGDLYHRVQAIELVNINTPLFWFPLLRAATPPGMVVARIDYSEDQHGQFEIRVGDRSVRVPGDPTFPAKVPPGGVAELLPVAFQNELRPWCEIANDLGYVSRNHQTFHTMLATELGSAVGALCCMSDTKACPARD